jgi:hypothetical protein
MNLPEETLLLQQVKGDCPDQVLSDQKVLGIVKQDARPGTQN